MRKGFTLVELAIVIVIIGLLVGGVLQGQELIRQAEIRNYIKEQSSIVSAIQLYKSKYNAFPGDDNKASTWFGTNCTSEISTFSAVVPCDGNIDYRINGSEIPFAHLKLGKFLSGSYGAVLSTTYGAYYDTSLNAMVWRIHTPITTLFAQNGFSWLDMLSQSDGGAFTPQETMQIDEKIDDGKASLGSLLGIRGGGVSGCTNPGSYNTAAAGGEDYLLTDTAKSCRPFYRLSL
jgi:prepilin-type N-terminal cleavage/methylation domain-containing protein